MIDRPFESTDAVRFVSGKYKGQIGKVVRWSDSGMRVTVIREKGFWGNFKPETLEKVDK